MYPPANHPVNTAMPSAQALRDRELVRAALAGCRKAHEELTRHYRGPLYIVLLKMVGNADDAEDLVMETLAKAFGNLGRYWPQFAFSTWLFRIATNHGIDFLRCRRVLPLARLAERQGEDGAEVALDVPDQEPNPQDAFIREQRCERVQQAVGQLPPKYRELVRLRYFEELSYEEVAQRLELPLGSVKAYLSRARAMLLEELRASWPEL